MLSRPQHYTSDYDILYYLDHIWLPNLLSNGLTSRPGSAALVSSIARHRLVPELLRLHR